ncbi:MAG: hypothetical protein Q9167_006007 [Letrouitia subvulpina]
MHLASTFLSLTFSACVVSSSSNPTFSGDIERLSTADVTSSTRIPEDKIDRTSLIPESSAVAPLAFTDPINAIQIRIPGSDIGLNIYLMPNAVDPAMFQPLFDEADKRIAEEVRHHGREGIVRSPFQQRDTDLGLQINFIWRFQWFDMMDVMRGFHILVMAHHPDKLFRFDIFHGLNHVAEGLVLRFSTTQPVRFLGGITTSSRDPFPEAA